MIDLTAPIESLGETPDITHIDLYYVGQQAPDSSLITRCSLLDLRECVERVDMPGLAGLDLVQDGDSVVLRTGWELYRGMPRYAESPSVDRRLIEELVQRGVALVLIDSPGVYGGARGSEHNEIDQYLADHEAYAVENLVNLEALPAEPFRLYCVPIYSSSRNNAPCRVFAEPL